MQTDESATDRGPVPTGREPGGRHWNNEIALEIEGLIQAGREFGDWND